MVDFKLAVIIVPVILGLTLATGIVLRPKAPWLIALFATLLFVFYPIGIYYAWNKLAVIFYLTILTVAGFVSHVVIRDHVEADRE